MLKHIQPQFQKRKEIIRKVINLNSDTPVKLLASYYIKALKVDANKKMWYNLINMFPDVMEMTWAANFRRAADRSITRYRQEQQYEEDHFIEVNREFEALNAEEEESEEEVLNDDQEECLTQIHDILADNHFVVTAAWLDDAAKAYNKIENPPEGNQEAEAGKGDRRMLHAVADPKKVVDIEVQKHPGVGIKSLEGFADNLTNKVRSTIEFAKMEEHTLNFTAEGLSLTQQGATIEDQTSLSEVAVTIVQAYNADTSNAPKMKKIRELLQGTQELSMKSMLGEIPKALRDTLTPNVLTSFLNTTRNEILKEVMKNPPILMRPIAGERI